jgi:hypothetical protein
MLRRIGDQRAGSVLCTRVVDLENGVFAQDVIYRHLSCLSGADGNRQDQDYCSDIGVRIVAASSKVSSWGLVLGICTKDTNHEAEVFTPPILKYLAAKPAERKPDH